MFISSGYNRGAGVVKFAPNKTSFVWEDRVMRNHFNSCVLYEGNLYGFDEMTLKCVRFNDGTEVWKKGGLGKGSVMLAGNKLIILGEKGQLVVAKASPTGFKAIAETNVHVGKGKVPRHWTVPVLANGLIYCRNAHGDVVCVDVRKK